MGDLLGGKGAKFSMPGMMERVLNVGISPEVAQALAEKTGFQNLLGTHFVALLKCTVELSAASPPESWKRFGRDIFKIWVSPLLQIFLLPRLKPCHANSSLT